MKKELILWLCVMIFAASCATNSPEISDAENAREIHVISLAMSGKTNKIAAFLDAYPSVDLNFYDSEGFTALQYAIGYKYTKTAALLIERGADVNIPTRSTWGHFNLWVGYSGTVVEGSTPLHMTVFWSLTETMEKLIAAGADVNAPDSLGYTPLHTAVHYGLAAPAEILLNNGAKNIKNNEGQTPLDFAREYKRKAIAESIEKKAIN